MYYSGKIHLIYTIPIVTITMLFHLPLALVWAEAIEKGVSTKSNIADVVTKQKVVIISLH